MAGEKFMKLGGQILFMDSILLEVPAVAPNLKPPSVLITAISNFVNETTPLQVTMTIGNRDVAGNAMRLHFAARPNSRGPAQGTPHNSNGVKVMDLPGGLLLPGDSLVIYAVTLAADGSKSNPSQSNIFAYTPSVAGGFPYSLPLGLGN